MMNTVEQALKSRLIQARRGGAIPLTESRRKDIKRLLEQGASKKIANTIFGTTCQQLKEIRNQ